MESHSKKLKRIAEEAIEVKGETAQVLIDAQMILKIAEMCQRMEAIMTMLHTYQWPLDPHVREALTQFQNET